MKPQRRIILIGWLAISAAIALGALGYLQTLFEWQLSSLNTWILLVSFLLVSVAQILMDRHKEKHAAEDFYGAEVTETFPRGTSADRMHFFVDKANNKCVALTLGHAAIPNSVRLWEGGYIAPAFTFLVQDNVVLFRNSAYTSHEEYQQPGPIYSVRYYPRKASRSPSASADSSANPLPSPA